MPQLDALYQALIVDHSRNPRHFGPLPQASHRGQRDNPFCGDEITVALVLAGDRIRDLRFQGAGCAIAMAAASMMTGHLEGKTRSEAVTIAHHFGQLIEGKPVDADLGELGAFAAVTQFPVRIQCARLPWRALLAALGRGEEE